MHVSVNEYVAIEHGEPPAPIIFLPRPASARPAKSSVSRSNVRAAAAFLICEG
jgi:hypothetical protein